MREPLTCEKCGAPMQSWRECEHCGTNYAKDLDTTLIEGVFDIHSNTPYHLPQNWIGSTYRYPTTVVPQ